jgi:hypothetical protein
VAAAGADGIDGAVGGGPQHGDSALHAPHLIRRGPVAQLGRLEPQADHITDFRSQEGDRLEISRQAFGIASSAVATVVTARNDAELTGMLASGNLFVFDQRDGSLLFNQNGSAAGAGNGGVFAVLSGVSGLQASSLALIA